MNRLEQRSVIRFEKRGRECIPVARLTTISVGSHSESKKTAARFSCEGPRANAREVTVVLSETGRSWPGQGEAARKLRGSPQEVLRYKRSRDLGQGVKCQSRSVMAGSFRNRPKSSLERGRYAGKATDSGASGSRLRPESNSELCNTVDLGSEGRRVRCRSERETTQSKVKAPNS